MSDMQMIPYSQPVISITAPNVPSLDTINSVKELAALAARSGMTKGKTLESAFFIAMYGMELGIPPMTAMRTIYSVAGGAPTCSGEAMLSLLRRSGKVRVSIPDPKIVAAEKSATVKIKRLDTGEEGEFTFTMEMANKAGLSEKNTNWKTYPHMMLIWRAVSMGAKLLCSDIIGGLYTVEEVYENTPVDETGAPIGDIVVSGSSQKQPPVPADDVKDATYSDIEPETKPATPHWPSTATIKLIYEHVKTKTVPDLSQTEFSRLAGVSSIDAIDEWKKFATGKDAAAAAIAKFTEETTSKPPSFNWTAEAEGDMDKHATDAYLLTHAEALALVTKASWSEFSNPDAAMTALKVAAIAKTIRVVARKARYVKAGNSGYTEFTDTPLPVRMYGSTEVFTKLGDAYVKLIEPLKAGQTVELPSPLSFEWERASSGNYITIKKDTIKEEFPF